MSITSISRLALVTIIASMAPTANAEFLYKHHTPGVVPSLAALANQVTQEIVIALTSASLPPAEANKPYFSYDFYPLVNISGSSGYSASEVSFSATGLPSGLELSKAGVLSGTPVTAAPGGATFSVVATYKSKTSQQQVYTLNVANTLFDAVSFAADGGFFSCAITTAGGVKCWGQNTNGELGNGGTTKSNTPVDVVGLSGVRAIALGGFHACAILDTGDLACWGLNSKGQLGDGTTTKRLTPVMVALGGSKAAAVSAGNEQTCIVTTLGGAKCWGGNTNGLLGDGTTTVRYTPVDVQGLSTGIIGISAGYTHSCALLADGTPKCWGFNSSGQLGDGTLTTRLTPVAVSGLSGVSKLTAGADSTCALTSTNGVKCWGLNLSGQVGDGTLSNRSTPTQVSGLSSGVASMFSDYYGVCVVLQTGAAKCWGNGATSGTTPVSVPGLSSGVAAVSVGYAHSCAMMTAGGLKCWGDNSMGQLGDGTWTNRTTPVSVQQF